jgi:hypothetical protein
MLFALSLLPLLKASSSHPRVVSILQAGQEKADIDLDDLDVRKPVKTTWEYVGRCAAAIVTMTTLFLEQLAEQNPGVTFVHKYPGLVKTNIFGQGWGSAWSVRKVLFTYVVPAVVGLTGISEEEIGQRGVYTLFSARFGGSGVGDSNGEKLLGNSKGGTAHEGVFLVKENDETVVNTKVLATLRGLGASDRVYKETMAILEPYM